MVVIVTLNLKDKYIVIHQDRSYIGNEWPLLSLVLSRF